MKRSMLSCEPTRRHVLVLSLARALSLSITLCMCTDMSWIETNWLMCQIDNPAQVGLVTPRVIESRVGNNRGDAPGQTVMTALLS